MILLKYIGHQYSTLKLPVYKENVLDADKTAYNEEVYEIHTSNGYKLRCSGNHRVLKNDNWEKVKYLNNCDSIHTSDGYVDILNVKKTSKIEDLYDLQVANYNVSFSNKRNSFQ